MSSASRPSDADVKPTRSANSTETCLRSVEGAMRDAGAGCPASAAPHSPQNLTPGVFEPPQVGQACESALPHSPQNFRPGSFSLPQAEQRISNSVNSYNRLTRRRGRAPSGRTTQRPPACLGDPCPC